MAVTLDALGQVTSLRRITVTRPRIRERVASLDFVASTSSSLLCAVVIALGIGRFPALGGDEGIYTDQAWSVLQGSISPYTYTYDHPFLGWVQLAPLQFYAMLFHVGGPLSVVNSRAVMVAYAFCTLMLTYGVARRLGIRVPYAVAGVLLVGLSPLYITDARQVYLDNIALPWVLAAFCLALSERRRQWTYAVAAILFAIGVLSKETVVLFLPALVYVVWVRAYRPIRLMSIASFVTAGTMIVSLYPLFAALRNELFPGKGHVSLWTNGVMYQLATRKGSGALWQDGSARNELIRGWLYYDHWLLLLGAGCAIAGCFVKRVRPAAMAVLLWSIPVIKPGGYLPSMYVIAVLPFCAVSVVGLADAVHSRIAVTARPKAIFGLVSAAALALSLVVGAAYLTGDRKLTTAHSSAVSVAEQAEKYIDAHANRQDNILADDVYWVDLVQAGFGYPWHGAISYYKFDLDPISADANLPAGWQEINYAIVTAEMRSNLQYLHLTKLQQVIQHSKVVAAWGTGSERVEVRKVQQTPFNVHRGAGS